MSTKQKAKPKMSSREHPMLHVRLHPDLRQRFKVIACQKGMTMQAIGEALIEEFVSSVEDVAA
jgi:peroxiredoxin family protein